ncbi:MAG: hypothetical protein A2340_02735 [Lentisphaerae bacterium RIFOXYB12_FULL_60_10]|nr:MAG: hypothetical protein A2269_07570 [Lentisphaerae bacterium RIFOXYA12_FULL_60_10]OGV84226.1 MAG: hypothetical protein A2340_02735 [Lentisphaerae bacterium RIFOXYB12_FULL_60_10]
MRACAVALLVFSVLTSSSGCNAVPSSPIPAGYADIEGSWIFHLLNATSSVARFTTDIAKGDAGWWETKWEDRGLLCVARGKVDGHAVWFVIDGGMGSGSLRGKIDSSMSRMDGTWSIPNRTGIWFAVREDASGEKESGLSGSAKDKLPGADTK